MHTVALARNAMATRFEIILHGEDSVSLRAAGEEALDEVERLENQLSLYRPASDIAHLNARAARGPVRVEPGLFRLLQEARKFHQETEGAFDITIAPLVRCWGFMGATGRIPSQAEIAEARSKVGMHLVELDGTNYSVRFACEGVMLDLGAIAKGYAIERAAALLREAGVTRAILHGGTSTVQAIGSPPELGGWNVAIEYPEETYWQPLAEAHRPTSKSLTVSPTPAIRSHHDEPSASPALLALVTLKDEALSVSAVSGKAFQYDNKIYGHVLDPRTGYPASHALLSAVVSPSATETDALSTALLTAGLKGHDAIAALRPALRTLVLASIQGKLKHRSSGIAVQDRNKKKSSGREKQR
jgi:thiamine biosynthesis lipoprotein